MQNSIFNRNFSWQPPFYFSRTSTSYQMEKCSPRKVPTRIIILTQLDYLTLGFWKTNQQNFVGTSVNNLLSTTSSRCYVQELSKPRARLVALLSSSKSRPQ